MLKPHHATTLTKPYSQIKDLKRHCPDELDHIKASHQKAWQAFKAFVLAVYGELPTHFAPPHLENWCNGWQIRNHLFAYFKYQRFVANAPIIAILLNRQRLIIELNWHAHKAKHSATSLDDYNAWTDKFEPSLFEGAWVYHDSVGEYGGLVPAVDFTANRADGWYRLAYVLPKERLADFDEQALVAWAVHAIQTISVAYEWCQG